jgi:hypothetical protein
MRQCAQIKAAFQGDGKMRVWAKLGIALAVGIASVQAGAQSTGGSEGEAFLKAVTDGDGAKAIPMAEMPGTHVINYRGFSGDTALHIVTRNREADWVGFLLNKGASPDIGDKQGDTPLMIAARIGFNTAADYMIRMGANVNLTNRRGESALIIAVQQRQPEVVSMLLKAGADPDKPDHAAGYSARDYAKRDTRNRELLRLIETVKSTRKQVAGPTIN